MSDYCLLLAARRVKSAILLYSDFRKCDEDALDLGTTWVSLMSNCVASLGCPDFSKNKFHVTFSCWLNIDCEVFRWQCKTNVTYLSLFFDKLSVRSRHLRDMHAFASDSAIASRRAVRRSLCCQICMVCSSWWTCIFRADNTFECTFVTSWRFQFPTIYPYRYDHRTLRHGVRCQGPRKLQLNYIFTIYWWWIKTITVITDMTSLTSFIECDIVESELYALFVTINGMWHCMD